MVVIRRIVGVAMVVAGLALGVVAAGWLVYNLHGLGLF